MKGAPSQQGGSGGFGGGFPQWLGMASQYMPPSQPGGGGIDYGGGTPQYSTPPPAPPAPPAPPPPTTTNTGQGFAGGYAPSPANGLLGSAGSGIASGVGLLNGSQSPQQIPWFNRGYGMPVVQQGGIVPQGGAGGNMQQFPPGLQQYLSGLFGGYR